VRKYIIAVLFSCILAVVSFAQTPAPTDLLETGWTFNVSGGYANLQNQATNNGFLTTAEVRVAKHWAGYLDQISVGKPSAIGFLGGASYEFSLAHVAKQSSFIDISKFSVAVKAGIGAARASADASPFKLAVEVGAALRYNLPAGMFVEPVDVRLVRSSVTGTQVIGNHLALIAAIGKRF
jgi:opacity protein-like surface antigen